MSSLKSRSAHLLLVAVVALPLVLTSCSPSSGSSQGGTAQAAVSLKTGKVSQGTVIVLGSGMTVYIYTKDTQNSGKSTCSNGCQQAWPPVLSPSSQVASTGITAKIGTIPGSNGESQVTVDGWPIYTFAGDHNPGQSSGQGITSDWYVLKPDGTPIRS